MKECLQSLRHSNPFEHNAPVQSELIYLVVFVIFMCVVNAVGSYSPLKLSRCVKKKDCLWKSSMATTMGPSRLLRSVFLDPLLSAISDSSIVRTMYSCTNAENVKLISIKLPLYEVFEGKVMILNM